MLCRTELGSPPVGFPTSLSPTLGVSLAQRQNGNIGGMEQVLYLGSLEDSLRVQSLGLARVVLICFNPANVLASSVTPFAQTLNVINK